MGLSIVCLAVWFWMNCCNSVDCIYYLLVIVVCVAWCFVWLARCLLVCLLFVSVVDWCDCLSLGLLVVVLLCLWGCLWLLPSFGELLVVMNLFACGRGGCLCLIRYCAGVGLVDFVCFVCGL